MPRQLVELLVLDRLQTDTDDIMNQANRAHHVLAAQQVSPKDVDRLADELLSTPFYTSELAPGVVGVGSGRLIERPEPEYSFDGYADIRDGTWLRFDASGELRGSIQYGVFSSSAEAHQAYQVIRSDAELVNSDGIVAQALPAIDGEAVVWTTFNAMTRDGSLGLRSAGAVATVGNVVVFSTVESGGGHDPGPYFAYALSFLATGVVHAVPLVANVSQAPTSQSDQSDTSSMSDMAGVSFSPNPLVVNVGQTVTVEAAMPDVEFGGPYALMLLIPPQMALTGDPRCVGATPEFCAGLQLEVTPQVDGSIAVEIGGYYGLTDPGRFILPLKVTDVGSGSGRVVISAHLVFYTSHVEYDPIETWIEVQYE